MRFVFLASAKRRLMDLRMVTIQPGRRELVGTSDIWHVDPITGALTVQIAIPTLPIGGRGPSYPYLFKYNSGSTITFQAEETYVTGGSQASESISTCYYAKDYSFLECSSSDNDVSVPGSQIEILQNYGWLGASTPYSSTQGPSGPWMVVNGPAEYNYYAMIQAQTLTAPNGVTINNYSGCDLSGPYIYIDPSGGSHDLNLSTNTNYPGTSGSILNPFPLCTIYSIASTSDLTDGSAIHATVNNGLVMPDGTQFLTNGNLEDSNGNIRTSTTDSLGRTPVIPSSTSITSTSLGAIIPGSYNIRTKDVNGNPETYQAVFSQESLGNFAMPYPGNNDIATSFCFAFECPTEINASPFPTGYISGLTSLSLPDGTSYKFYYDPLYATIDKIAFPTGGYVRFVWGIKPVAEQVKGVASESALVVTDAYISNDSGGEDHWNYSYPQNVTLPVQWTSTVTAPDGSYTNYIGGGVSFSTIFTGGAPTVFETERDMYDKSGNELMSVVKTGGIFPSYIITTHWDTKSNNQQQVHYVYDQYNNVAEKDESDFYSCATATPCTKITIPWLRKTFTSYLWSSPAPSQPEFATTYTQAHIVNKPSQVLVTDGSGNPASLTIYTYDETGHIGSTPTGISTHDDLNYGPGSTMPRGNLTTETRCIAISGTGSSANCTSSWNTSYYYDLTGQITKKIEGANTSKAAPTSYTWSGVSTGNNGYLSNVLYPNGASDSYTYYTPTGQVASHMGWNKTDQTTTYAYADSMNRLTSITNPIGLTTYTYTDTSGAFSVLAKQWVTSNTIMSATKTYDGLGRIVRSISSAPQCSSGVETDTTYDLMSRVYSVSSPYCRSSSAG